MKLPLISVGKTNIDEEVSFLKSLIVIVSRGHVVILTLARLLSQMSFR